MDTYRLSRILSLIALSLLILPAARAQYIESQEPNQPCSQAEYVGVPGALPADLAGELTPTGEEPPGDVDFFIFEYAPGTRLRAQLLGNPSGSGTLGDPYLGLFDSQCGLMAVNDDYQGLESRLDFVVPPDGIFILAATGCCDGTFDGYHWYQGTYLLTISEPPVPIQAITGRVVDAISGEPLPGNLPPYAWVELRRCDEFGNCYYQMSSQSTDALGLFRFETDWWGNPLEPDDYVIAVSASEYQSAEIGPFHVMSGEAYDVGDIALQPPPFVFENIAPCAGIPAAGGTCRYSVDIRNNTGAAVRGLGWSLVNAWGGTSPWGSWFQADKVNRVRLAALSSRTLNFSFEVPGEVAEGTSMCVDAWFSDRETQFFGTLRSGHLFCVMKQFGTLQLVEPKAAAAIRGTGRVVSDKGVPVWNAR